MSDNSNKIKVAVDLEESYNDPVFTALNSGFSNEIVDDKFYPMDRIKIWFFKNSEDIDAWLSFLTLPIPALYNPYLLTNKFPNSVFIIVRFKIINSEDYMSFKAMIKHLENIIGITEDTRSRVLEILRDMYINQHYTGETNIRFLFVINSKQLLEEDVLIIGNSIFISSKLEKLTVVNNDSINDSNLNIMDRLKSLNIRPVELKKRGLDYILPKKDNRIEIVLDFYSDKEREVKFNIFDKEIEANAEKSDMLEFSDEPEFMISYFIKSKKDGIIGPFSIEKETSISLVRDKELINELKKVRKEKIDKLLKIETTKLNLVKEIIKKERDIIGILESLTKEKIAELGLKKAEIDITTNVIKRIKDILL